MEIGNIVRVNRGNHKGEEVAVLDIDNDGVVTTAGRFRTGALTFVAANEAEYVEMGEMTDAEIVPTIMEVTENPVGFEIPEPCACGCGAPAGKDAKFVPGHDQKLRSRLLIEFDHGSDNQRSQSRERLVGLGWYTEADLDERDERNQSEANSKADKIRARIEKLNVKMAKLTEDIAKLETQREIEEFRSER